MSAMTAAFAESSHGGWRDRQRPSAHAGQRHVVARGVVSAVPPRSSAQRRSLARPHAGADVRSANGVHPVRDHRCRCPAELAGATGAGEPDQRAMAMSRDQRRALRLLAAAPNGATEAIMLAHVRGNEIGRNLILPLRPLQWQACARMAPNAQRPRQPLALPSNFCDVTAERSCLR
jgi:hypothetical protein